LSADAEFVAAPGLQSLGVSDMPGRDAARRALSESAELFQYWQLTPRGFIDLGNRFVALGTPRAEGGVSRAPVEAPYALLIDVGDRGLVTRQSEFDDWDAALHAAGLRRDQVLGLEALAVPQRDV
jgi:hypothetical protein